MVDVAIRGMLNLKDLPRLVGAFGPALRASRDKAEDTKVRVDLKKLTFVTAAPLAVMTAAVLQLVRDPRVSVSFEFPEDEGVHDYLTRMDFYKVVEQPIQYRWRRHASEGRFREPMEVVDEDDCHDVARDLGTILAKQGELPESSRASLQNILSELLENVHHHAAESKVNALVCAQAYPRQARVEMGIVDTGRGFEASLTDNPEHRDQFSGPLEAIELALREHVTATPERNSGVGLYFTKQLVNKNQGRMYVLSGGGLKVEDGRGGWSKSVASWDGAILGLSLRTDQFLDLKPIFDRMYPPENDFDLFEEVTPP